MNCMMIIPPYGWECLSKMSKMYIFFWFFELLLNPGNLQEMPTDIHNMVTKWFRVHTIQTTKLTCMEKKIKPGLHQHSIVLMFVNGLHWPHGILQNTSNHTLFSLHHHERSFLSATISNQEIGKTRNICKCCKPPNQKCKTLL